MPKVGDRVIVQTNKVGGARREGTLVAVVGSLINVRWTDGTTSLFSPGAGAVAFEPQARNGGDAKAPKAAAKPAPAKAAAPKKAPAKKKR
jgi:hypothetical protein